MYLIIDIGGTFIKHSMMTRDAEIVEKGKVETPYTLGRGMKCVQDGVDAFMKVIENIYAGYRGRYDMKGIAISMPGLVDVENGIAYGCGALPYLDKQPLGELISRECDGLPVAMENDAKCAALAEVWRGNGKDCNNIVVLVFGTGIGGGIVVDRKILHGRGMVAGELSNLFENVTRENLYQSTPLEEGLRSGDENFKLPDDYIWCMQASVSSLRRDVAKVKGLVEDEVSGEMIYQWDADGDKAVHEVLESWYLNIAKHCMNLHIILAPDIILLGGGISAQPKFIEGVKKYVRILAKFSIMYNEMNIGLCKFGNDSNLIGALFNYLQKYEGEQ